MKTKRTTRTALTAITLAAGLAAPAVASASYVCTAFLSPGDNIWGDDGYVVATYYSGPACTGSYQAGKTYCSANANTISCASSPQYSYSAESLIALYHALRYAADVAQRVDYYTSGCFFGGSGCGSVVVFRGN
ncbi:MAG: hypothetical protein K0V04_44085 [Deltaproteobacteria bacterium]|nr:hypothetical protein [Deltaproteobacteria bacterium]